MKKQTALEKIKTLTMAELDHRIQLMDYEIEYYKLCIQNYPPERMEKYGKPYLKKLEEQKQVFVEEKNQR